MSTPNDGGPAFTFSVKSYPNGENYFLISCGNLVIGACKKSGDEFLVTGKRKPVPDLIHAAKQMIARRLAECRANEARWTNAMRALLTGRPMLAARMEGQGK
jgi:hypothetical protein